MMRADLEAAGVPYQDEDGLFADFHANRHTFITNPGRAGIPLGTAQKLARHSDPKLTGNIYTHLEAPARTTRLPSACQSLAMNGAQAGNPRHKE